MKNNTNFSNNVYDFIEERINESYTILNKNKEYKQIQDKYIKSLTDIRSNLSNNVEMLEEHASNEADLYTMQLQEAYKIGFKDSIRILTDKDF